ncbi:MAG: M1 family peptidase, partial [Actinomycetota bacterium]|nr:M1 family peptidase [Actinomycetota bacterium]
MKAKVAAATTCLAVFVCAAVATAGGLFEGAAGVGDPYYPKMGNTGYDVQAYDVRLYYKRSGKVQSKTVIEAVADTDDGASSAGAPIRRFDLDFRGPRIRGLNVNGEAASFIRQGQELVIDPATPIADSQPFEVAVHYKGRPKQVANPDGSRDGWTYTQDGALALGEPQQTPSWAPVNDHPTDKATWRLRLRTPRALTGISNGEYVGKTQSGRHTTTEWAQDEPMASYLALAAIGEFRVDKGEVAGLPYVGAVDRNLGESVVDDLR